MSDRVYRVVLVEDNSADVYLIELAFRFAGLTVDFAVLSDGAEAIAFVHGMDSGNIPDLAVIDLNLPKNSGAEVLRAWRKNALLAPVPVTIMTSSSSPHDRAEIEQLGVEQYLTKPPDLDEFLKMGEMFREILVNRPE